MNRQIGKLFIFSILLIAALAFSTSWWSVWRADALKDEPLNRRPLLEQQQIPRGLVLARDGTKLAVNKRRVGADNKPTYFRQYPEGSLFSHDVGYAFVSKGSSGIERSHNDVLS